MIAACVKSIIERVSERGTALITVNRVNGGFIMTRTTVAMAMITLGFLLHLFATMP